MARYCIVVFTDSVKGAEMDFTRWYDERRSAEDRCESPARYSLIDAGHFRFERQEPEWVVYQYSVQDAF
jgi:hypothetical protein